MIAITCIKNVTHLAKRRVPGSYKKKNYSTKMAFDCAMTVYT